MKYFKAYPMAERPFMQWGLIAKSLAELETLGLDDDPLILAENLIPATEYGVCPLKIEGGELVERSTEEMDVFEVQFEMRNSLNNQAKKVRDLNVETFTYDDTDFPLNEAARIYYGAVNFLAANAKIMDATGAEYTLLAGNIPAFMTAYYTKLKTLTQPPV